MLWPFAYVLVMLAFAGQARSNRQSHGSAIGAGMLVVTILRGAAFSAVSASKSDASAVLLVYALPLSGIIGGLWYLTRSRPVALPVPVQQRFDALALQMNRRAEALQARYLAWRRQRAGARA